MQHKQPLIIPVKESGDVYELAFDYELDLSPFGYHMILVIPKGFRYDGMSVPRWLWSISGFGIDGLHRAAVIVHDYLYVKNGELGLIGGDEIMRFSRKQVDKLMRDIMTDAAIAEHRVKFAYWAVRLFGVFVWKKH